ncbi:MAG: hypothetical protein VKP63_11705, partial [Cyanobacteriota bacterium]|nr:hypothetical protein [Cyanobacteriota bacterium]
STVSVKDRDWIAEFLGRPRQRRLPREVFRLHELLEASGSIDWAVQVAHSFTEAAVREFDTSAFAGVPKGADLTWLHHCIGFLLKRDL